MGASPHPGPPEGGSGLFTRARRVLQGREADVRPLRPVPQVRKFIKQELAFRMWPDIDIFYEMGKPPVAYVFDDKEPGSVLRKTQADRVVPLTTMNYDQIAEYFGGLGFQKVEGTGTSEDVSMNWTTVKNNGKLMYWENTKTEVRWDNSYGTGEEEMPYEPVSTEEALRAARLRDGRVHEGF